MSRLTDGLVDRVRERIDIVDAISRHVSLKRVGRRFRGLCPFHGEKTPSFYVDPERQLFYCFGCQAGGDVFTFFMRVDHLTFPEVVKHLADLAGIPVESVEVSPETARKRREWETLANAAEAAARYYQKRLTEAPGASARAYLLQRGVSARAVEAFRLGYAPPGWQSLRDHLASVGIPEEIGLKAGLLGQGRRGLFDRLRNRITFPICDVRGRVIGFGGRALDAKEVKYINSPESALYVKREHLYGLNVVVSARREVERIVLVEGYMDVISLFDQGIDYAVASLGTALTPDQGRLLKRYTKEVIIAYDADKAGESAASRGMDILAAEGLDVRVARLPQGDDPDSFVRRHGLQALQQVLDQSVALYEYKITQALRGVDLTKVEGRVQAVDQVVPVLANIDSAVAKEGYIELTASRLGVSIRALNEEIAKYESGKRNERIVRHNLSTTRYTSTDSAQPRRPKQAVTRPDRTDRVRVAVNPAVPRRSNVHDLLACLLREPGRTSEVVEILGSTPFAAFEENNLLQWLLAQGECEVTGETLVDRIKDRDLAEFARSLLAEQQRPLAPFDVYLKRAREEALKAEVEGVEARLERLMIEEWMTKQEVDRLLVHLKGIRDILRHQLDRIVS